MKFEHVAIWVTNLELIRDFYVKYFEMSCSDKYINSKKQFSSYFLSFKNSETRLEIMFSPDIGELNGNKGKILGFTHLSISVGNKKKVGELTEILRSDGYVVESEPRTTGDGYYESVILDPEGNYIEITE